MSIYDTMISILDQLSMEAKKQAALEESKRDYRVYDALMKELTKLMEQDIAEIQEIEKQIIKLYKTILNDSTREDFGSGDNEIR